MNPNGESSDINGRFSSDVADRVPEMLFLLNLCFTAISVISLILTFEGPDPTKLTDEVEEKITAA